MPEMTYVCPQIGSTDYLEYEEETTFEDQINELKEKYLRDILDYIQQFRNIRQNIGLDQITVKIHYIDAEGIKSFVDGLVPKLFGSGKEHEEELQLAKDIGYGTSPDGAKDALKAMKQRPDRSHVLKNTTLPVLIVAGEQDQIVPPEKSFTVERPNIQQALIHGAGHMSMYEDPLKLIKEIKEFLKN